MSDKDTYLTNQFLIAMPNLMDPNFFHSVTYICEHSEQGAMGIVINQPVELSLGELMAQMDMHAHDEAQAAQAVFRGGPVEPERGFVLHRPLGKWESSMAVTDEIGLTTSTDILRAMSEGNSPDDVLITLGYAGWGAGQLEQEMLDNAWLSGPADPAIIFATPVEQRWEAAARLVGVDINQLTGDAGHA
ncbi:MAG TPA: YqgE/AlgH family protein [Gammaproteobacteria bacterium]|nr:YqgE/AlgH family protein [Gammaproteobacteria bacterium]